MHNQYIIRPVRSADLSEILALAEKAKPGMTNLLPDRDLLAHKIEWSMSSFKKNVTAPANELYFFVMEEVRHHHVIGTCGIFSDVGDDFYSFKVFRELVTSELLKIKHENHYLQLVNDYKNVSELALLLIGQKHRKKGLGKFLSRSRYLFLADNLEKFHKHIIAEMRGVIDIWGKSAFWDAVGSRFIDLKFTEADLLSAKHNKHFIQDLLPHTPISIALLSLQAQKVIGQPHPDTAAAVKVLQDEGFEYSHYVDIFDAGPTLEAILKHIKTIEESHHIKVVSIQKPQSSSPCMASFQGEEFRASIGEIAFLGNDGVCMSPTLAQVLGCTVGDMVRIMIL